MNSVLFDAPGPRARRRIMLGNVVGLALLAGVLVWVGIQLQQAGQLEPAKWASVLTPSAFANTWATGVGNTLLAAAWAIVGSVVFGFVFGVARMSRWAVLRAFAGAVVEFFRAVPVFVMMIAGWILLGQTRLVEGSLNAMVGVIIGLILYNGSVIAELLRGGVANLPRGQKEAGMAVGLRDGQTLRSVQLPQAIVAMLPSLVSQFVVVVKDTALGSWISYQELLRSGQILGTNTVGLPMLQALAVAAGIYVLLNAALSFGANRLARLLQRRTAVAISAAAPPALPNAKAAAK